MAQIRWDNIASPAIGDSRGLYYAGLLGKQATDNFGEVFKQQNTQTDVNWENTKANNTANRMALIQSLRTPEALAEAQASGALNMDAFGAQIDKAAIMNTLDARPDILQRRSVADQQYKDQQTDLTQRPIVAGYQGALAQAKTPEDVQSLMGSMQAASGAGAIDPRAFSAIMKDALGRNTNLVSADQAAVTHTRQGTKLDADITDQVARQKAEQERLSILREELGIKQAEVVERAAERKATASNAGITAKATYLKHASDLVEAQSAAIKEIETNTPYAVKYSSKNRDKIGEAATKLNKGDMDYGNSVLTKLDDYIQESGAKVPVSVIEAAMNRASNDTLNWTNSNRGYGRNVVDYVKEAMKNPATIGGMAYAEEVMAKAHGTYSGSKLPEAKLVTPPITVPITPTSTTVAATPISATAAAPKPLPPQLQSPPPEVAKSGALVYSSPGAFNISSNKGIMTPSKMPTGKIEATVKDGDTIGVTGANGVTMDFRFNGLDAQETAKTKDGKTTPGQKYSEEAKAFITESLKNGKVDIKMASNKPDKYGRHLADVYVNGESLNEALLRKGLASVLKVPGGIGPSQNAAFTRLQEEAMRGNLGIMGDLNSDRAPTGAMFRMFGDDVYN